MDTADKLNASQMNSSTSSNSSSSTLLLNSSLWLGGDVGGEMDVVDTCSSVYLERVLVAHVIGKICLLGIAGNILNLIVLTQKQLTTNMERLERGAHMGLVALAVSDLLFCLAAYPHCWLSTEELQEYTHPDFWLIYQVYGSAVINIFILSSTWITVAMAVTRYLAICRPLHSVQYLGLTAVRRAIFLISIFSVIFNIPRFFFNKVETYEDVNTTIYYKYVGPLKRIENAQTVYSWLYFILGILIPLCLLAYCNFFLIRTLNKSRQLRHQQGHQAAGRDTKGVLTLTLSIIVVFYLLFVVPSESLTFVQEVIMSGGGGGNQRQHITFNLCVTVCNTLQAINFAFNFVLYCLINAKFRRTITDLLCCVACKNIRLGKFMSISSRSTRTMSLA